MHFALSSCGGFPNFNESAPLQPLQSGSIDAKFCRRTKRHSATFILKLCEELYFAARKSVRQFAAAQTFGCLTPRSRQMNLSLRFQLRQRRQHRSKNFADRRQVIPRNPLRQLDQFWCERGNKIQDARDLANLRACRHTLREFDDDADHRFLPERHKHAAAGLQSSAQRFRDRVGKRRAQRHRQRHVAKSAVHLAV